MSQEIFPSMLLGWIGPAVAISRHRATVVYEQPLQMCSMTGSNGVCPENTIITLLLSVTCIIVLSRRKVVDHLSPLA